MSLLDTLKLCDADVYPCINQLLIIGCTLPLTRCEAELSFSSVQLTMNHLRSSMGEGSALSASFSTLPQRNSSIKPSRLSKEHAYSCTLFVVRHYF